MHHGSRRFPVRSVTAGVSAESAGVCEAPSVICGLGFHGLDFKRCLARLTSAPSHTKTPKKRGVRGSLSRQPQPPGGTFSCGVEAFSWDKCAAPSPPWRKLPRMARMGHTTSLLARVGSLGRALPARPQARARVGPATQPFKTS